MEPITSWTAERVSGWLRGLDASLQQYAFERWQLSGLGLLQLSSQQLELLGVHKIGHQELILEAVEKLCTLTYGLGGESLRGLMEKLRAVAHSLQMGVQSRWRNNKYDGQSATKLPAPILQVIVELITAAKGLFSLLNRYQYTQMSGYSGSNIITLCKDLGSIINKEVSVFEKEKDIIAIVFNLKSSCAKVLCEVMEDHTHYRGMNRDETRQLVAICDETLSSAPEGLLSLTTQLQSVELAPVTPGQQLGVEITSTAYSQHFISGTAPQCPPELSEKILAGDEVIQVNDQIVVGWSRKNLEEKLQENLPGLSLLLRRVPVSLRRRENPHDSAASVKRGAKPVESSCSLGEERGEEEEEDEEEGGRLSVFTGTPTSLHISRTPEGHESKRFTDCSFDGNQLFTTDTEQQRTVVKLETPSMERSPSPLSLDSNRARVGSCPEMGGGGEEKENNKCTRKGTRTALSRRRVSCRELGRPDCDGWLWKKRKEASVFLTHKWQRFWFVLKGATIYWYTSQQEEKAVGLVKIGSYNIESAGEHKRKYVFKMSHPRFQNFFFAADNVTDMSKWINCLITAIQKYKKLYQNQPDSEAECYSETESEEDGSNSPNLLKKKISTKTQSNTLPRTLGKKSKPTREAALTSSPAGGSKAPVVEDEMSDLFNKLKEGGVSLIGQSQPMTHDQLRRSFIRRNKNPVINEKIHTLRALQSTLKAKEAELQIINKVLEDSELTALKFRQWKQHNEELYQEIEKLAAEKKQQQTASAAKGVAGGDSGTCSLSDGEQLVDSELPIHGDGAQDTQRDHSTGRDSYFYI